MFEGVLFCFLKTAASWLLPPYAPECVGALLCNNNLILLKILGPVSRGVECSKNTLAGLRVSYSSFGRRG